MSFAIKVGTESHGRGNRLLDRLRSRRRSMKNAAADINSASMGLSVEFCGRVGTSLEADCWELGDCAWKIYMDLF